MSALTSTMTAPRPRNRLIASRAPSGRPISAASTTALRVTRSDSDTICRNCGSSPDMRPKAAEKAVATSIGTSI